MQNVTIQRQAILSLTNEQYGLYHVNGHENLSRDINAEFTYALHTNRLSPNAVKDQMNALRISLGAAVADEVKFVETVNAVIREFYQI